MLTIPPLAGDLLGSEARVDVWFRPSPLRAERRRLVLAAGLSLAEIVAACRDAGLTGPDARLHLTIDGHPIERRLWSRVRVKPGRVVGIVVVPGAGAFKQVLAVVVAIAALVVAPFIAAPIISSLGVAAGGAAAAAITGAIGIGLTVAGTLALNALFPTAKATSSLSDDTTTLYSIGGAQNQSSQYGAVPVVFGVHRISPPYASGAHTEIVGDDQYLRMLFCVGYGPIGVSDLKIGETPIGDFEDVAWEVIEDHTVRSATLYTQPVYEETVSATLTAAAGWVQRTTAADVEEISVDLSWPSGVYRWQKSNGNRAAYTVVVEVQYARTGTGAWVFAGRIDLTAASAQAVRRTLPWSVAKGQYDVRIAKVSGDYTGDDTVAETTYWAAVRGRRKIAAISFPKPLTLIALRIKATNQLNGAVSTLNCIASPKIRSWDGTTWASGRVTRNPADHFREVLQGNANARPVADAAIDLPGLEAWHDFCAAEGFTFDLVAIDQKSVWERLSDIAAAGRAVVSFRDGKWGVVWDEADTGVVQHFGPRNSWGFSSKRAFADLPHGFRVAFINRENGYLSDERVVYDDGWTEADASKFEGLEFPGVTDPGLIWRHGRYHIAQLRLQREVYTLSTDFEHLVCTRGDRVRVAHDVVKWGLGTGRVRSLAPDRRGVTLDETLTMEAGKAYALRFRLADGRSLLRAVETVAGETRSFVFADEGEPPGLGDLALFGEAGLDSVVLRVKSITPQADLTATIELVDDAPAILDADTGEIPPFVTGIAGPVDRRADAPSALTATEEVWSTSPPTSVLRLAWVAPASGSVANYLVQSRPRGSADWSKAESTGAAKLDLVGVSAGAFDVRIRAVFTDGELSGWLAGTVVAAIHGAVPDDVAAFRIAVAGDLATLQWEVSTRPIVSHHQIRFSPAIVGVTWESAAVLRSVVAGNQIQLPAMRGTYLIKAVSWAGLVSAGASAIVSTVDPATAYNAVETVDEAPAWSGSFDAVTLLSGTLRLVTLGDVFDATDFFETTDFFLGHGGFVPRGVYDFAAPVDLGSVFTSRVTAAIDAFGELASEEMFSRDDFFEPADVFGAGAVGLWDVTVETSVTDDDPDVAPVWSDWAELVAGSITARAIRFRAVLTSGHADVTPVVARLSVSVDMPDRVLAGDDLAVPEGGLAIAFDPPFYALQGVSIAAQGLASGDTWAITDKSRTGFRIAFRDAAGAPVARTFDYVAKGHGVLQ